MKWIHIQCQANCVKKTKHTLSHMALLVTDSNKKFCSCPCYLSKLPSLKLSKIAVIATIAIISQKLSYPMLPVDIDFVCTGTGWRYLAVLVCRENNMWAVFIWGSPHYSVLRHHSKYQSWRRNCTKHWDESSTSCWQEPADWWAAIELSHRDAILLLPISALHVTNVDRVEHCLSQQWINLWVSHFNDSLYYCVCRAVEWYQVNLTSLQAIQLL